MTWNNIIILKGETEINSYQVLFKKQRKGYTVWVPKLSGCISQGENLNEALQNIKEAIKIYLETQKIFVGAEQS